MSEIEGLPIVSLQSGEIVAAARRPIFDMPTLAIIAFLCDLPGSKQPVVLMTGDIRQVSGDCLIIDSENELTDPDDVIRLAPHLKANYNPQGKPVHADTGRRLGTVDDYTLNLDNCHLQKLYVRSSLLRSWLGSSLAIDRSQIIDVTPNQITVRDSTVEARLLSTETLPESPA